MIPKTNIEILLIFLTFPRFLKKFLIGYFMFLQKAMSTMDWPWAGIAEIVSEFETLVRLR
jgi:hypothetical protein